jgi:hypothetical protein
MLAEVLSARYLAVYLQDHLAGATGGLELARRAAGSNEGTPLGDFLERLAAEIEEDRETLKGLMESLEIGQDRIKVGGAWVAEKVGRLKLNGELLRSSPLSRLEELEVLGLGVEGKLALWRTLRQELAEDLQGVDLDALITRARSQRRRIERLRLEAARSALSR